MSGGGELISDVGEFGLITRIDAALDGHSAAGVHVGIGDDAAVVGVRGGRVVVSTDMLVEGRHFRRDWSTGADIGAKAAAQNLIDVAVMGARTTTLVVALGSARGPAGRLGDRLLRRPACRGRGRGRGDRGR